MPHRDMVISPPPRRVHLVTFSGAHGVGKTTLVSDIAASLKQDGSLVSIQESISTAWFNKEKAQRAQAGLPPLDTYDDINRLGIREKCQEEMVGFFKNMLLNTVHNALVELRMFYKQDTIWVLCDRWFSDIYAYTAMECSNDAFVHAQYDLIRQTAPKVIEKCLEACVEERFGFAVTHIIIPLASCSHTAQDTKPNRGTCDPIQWENACRSIFPYVADPEHTFIIASGDRGRRERELFFRLRG